MTSESRELSTDDDDPEFSNISFPTEMSMQKVRPTSYVLRPTSYALRPTSNVNLSAIVVMTRCDRTAVVHATQCSLCRTHTHSKQLPTAAPRFRCVFGMRFGDDRLPYVLAGRGTNLLRCCFQARRKARLVNVTVLLRVFGQLLWLVV